MDLRKEDLVWASEQGLLGSAQVDPLWDALAARAPAAPTLISATSPSTASESNAAMPMAVVEAPVRPRFDLLHVAYYFGALIVMGAMGFFMTLGWESFGGGGLFAIATAYAAVFVLAGRVLWKRTETRVPGGLLFTMAVCMTPLAAYGFERLVGVWPGAEEGDPGSFRDFHVYVRSGWLWMELATVAAGLVALRFVRFPFITAPLAFVAWYMSMDIAPALFGHDLEHNDRAWVSAIVGAAMLIVAYVVDRRTREDYSYWGYLFGLMAFWGGLSWMQSDSAINKILYCVLNVGLIVIAPLLGRRVFAVFGGLGVFGYLAYLSHEAFEDSVLFPFALSAIGLAILGTAIAYAKKREAIDRWVKSVTPAWLTRVLPTARKPV